MRLFINYIKDVYGGLFRCVALGGLLDALSKSGMDPASRKAVRCVSNIASLLNLSKFVCSSQSFNRTKADLSDY